MFERTFEAAGKLVPLQSGDYVLSDKDAHTMGVERKRWSDLLASVRDGRLKRQLPILSRSFSHPVLLLEGGYGRSRDGKIVVDGKTTGYSYASVQGLLNWARFHLGVQVVYTPDLAGTMEWLRITHSKAMRGCFGD